MNPSVPAEAFQSGHSRNSSYASQHSKISGTQSQVSHGCFIHDGVSMILTPLLFNIWHWCPHGLLQDTARSTPVPPACRTSRIAEIPRQEAAPPGACASRLTPPQMGTRTLDVRRDPLDPHDQFYPQIGLRGTHRVRLVVWLCSLNRTRLTIFILHCVSGGSRTRWRVTPPGWTTLAWMPTTSWRKSSKARTLQTSATLKVQKRKDQKHAA